MSAVLTIWYDKCYGQAAYPPPRFACVRGAARATVDKTSPIFEFSAILAKTVLDTLEFPTEVAHGVRRGVPR